MEIQIDQHTLERAEERGTNENEIIDVINREELKYFILSRKIR
jgi:hypothetical protein